MSTEQTPEVAMDTQGGNDGRYNGDGGDGRVDNREFRRSRHRECYCRGRNKSCPKCGGTGQLLPNWRENLNAARQSRGGNGGGGGQGNPMGDGPTAMVQDAGGRDAGGGNSAGVQERDGYGQRDNGYRQDRGDRGGDRGGDRAGGRGRWEQRRQQGGRSNNAGGGRQMHNKGKVCPMCGDFVPSLKQHVLQRHDD